MKPGMPGARPNFVSDLTRPRGRCSGGDACASHPRLASRGHVPQEAVQVAEALVLRALPVVEAAPAPTSGLRAVVTTGDSLAALAAVIEETEARCPVMNLLLDAKVDLRIEWIHRSGDHLESVPHP